MIVEESKKVTETEVTSLTMRVSGGSQGLIVCQLDVGEPGTNVEDVLGVGDDDEEGPFCISFMGVKEGRQRRDSGHTSHTTCYINKLLQHLNDVYLLRPHHASTSSAGGRSKFITA